MTQKEQEDYDKLTPELQQDYNYIRSKYPNWGHNQIMTKMSMEPTIIDLLNKNKITKPIDEDPEILKLVFEGAKKTLINLGIAIDAVFEALDAAISTLTDLIWQGVKYIGNKLKDFWDWLNS